MANKQDQKLVAAALASEDADYMAHLAEGYYYGHGRDRNLKLALQLWERSAALGNADALYYSGVCRYYGDGLPRDRAAAFRLWEQAAAKGHTGAAMSLETLRGTGDND